MDESELRERRAVRARGRARRRRRRRLGAGGALLVGLGALASVVVALASGGGSAHRHPPTGGAPVATRPSHRARGATRRDATLRLGPATGRPGRARAPVLMYHVIAPPPAGAPFPGLYVPPAEFAAQMRALKRAGWVAVTLDELAANWRDGARLPPGKPIVITFDNGYHSQWASALPVLHRLGWVADENMQLTGLPPAQGGLSDGEVRALVHAGWELDTQGVSHADLVTLAPAELRAQTAGARRTLQRRYDVPVRWFCYPSGHYDPTVERAVRAAGFVGSTTVVPGWAGRGDDPFRLPRLRVLGGTSPAGLLAQIAGARGDGGAPASFTVG